LYCNNLDIFMSGKRQHFIPQFLQEGFASHTNSGGKFTWVYRRGSSPFNTNIKNIGVEGQFYTENQETEVDDTITAAEGKLSALISDLKAEVPSSLVDPQLPNLIAHLEIRTRHLREAFIRTVDLISSKLLDFMSDEKAFTDFLIRRIFSDPTILHDLLTKELTRHGLPQALLEPLMKLSALHGPDLLRRQAPELLRIATALRSMLPKKLEQAAKTGHIKALKKSITPAIRVQRYGELSYNVASVDEGPLILGDSIVLFHVEGTKPYKALLDKNDNLKAVFLPLEPRKVLVGVSQGFDAKTFNLSEAIARCSLEYFISAEKSDTNDRLSNFIGADAALLSPEELEDLITETILE